MLDLYHGIWQGQPLEPNEYVLCADEKTSIQARRRMADPIPPTETIPSLSSTNMNAKVRWLILQLGCASAKVFDDVSKTGIAPFNRLLTQIMNQAPYKDAKRVFLIIDNASAHRGDSCIQRLQAAWPNIVPVHLPVHASWLNQIEIYFSIIQRKVLTPNHFDCTDAVADRLLRFQSRYEAVAKPFNWKFTRAELTAFMEKLNGYQQAA